MAQTIYNRKEANIFDCSCFFFLLLFSLYIAFVNVYFGQLFILYVIETELLLSYYLSFFVWHGIRCVFCERKTCRMMAQLSTIHFLTPLCVVSESIHTLRHSQSWVWMWPKSTCVRILSCSFSYYFGCHWWVVNRLNLDRFIAFPWSHVKNKFANEDLTRSLE